MTTPTDSRKSLIEEHAITKRGAEALAAARLALRVIRLLLSAKESSGVSQKDLASRLDVSDGRVSQVMSGDGNIHIATLARFMHAMGYEVEVNAVPLRPGLKRLHGRTQRRARHRGPNEESSDFEVYEQNFLTAHGPVRVPMYIPTDDVLGCAPEGRPERIGRVRITGGSVSSLARRVHGRSTAWQAKSRRVSTQ